MARIMRINGSVTTLATKNSISSWLNIFNSSTDSFRRLRSSLDMISSLSSTIFEALILWFSKGDRSCLVLHGMWTKPIGDHSFHIFEGCRTIHISTVKDVDMSRSKILSNGLINSYDTARYLIYKNLDVSGWVIFWKLLSLFNNGS